jgi:putative PIN family toxin of toxin-antitoxin system
MAERRVVIDTNVYLSGSMSRTSTPAQAIRIAYAYFEPIYSEATIAELVEKLTSPRMARWIEPSEQVALLAFVLGKGSLVEPVQLMTLLPDPGDDIFASLALAADASAIITGDKAFLAVGDVGGIPVLSPRSFLERHETL